MRKGIIRITLEAIQEALKFPPGWKIEDIKMVDGAYPEIEAVISGNDFQEVKEIKRYNVITHKQAEQFIYEVKEIEDAT